MVEEENIGKNPEQLTDEDLRNIEEEENRGFLGRAVDVVAEFVAQNPNLVKGVIGVASAVIGGVLTGPGAVAAGVVGAVAAEGGVALAEKRHAGTLRRRASIEKRDRLMDVEFSKGKQKTVENDGVDLQNQKSDVQSKMASSNVPGLDPHIVDVSKLQGAENQKTSGGAAHGG